MSTPEVQSVVSGIIRREASIRALFVAELSVDGQATVSVTPSAQLSPETEARWQAALRQMVDVLRECNAGSTTP